MRKKIRIWDYRSILSRQELPAGFFIAWSFRVIQLLHGDCLELMRDIPGGAVDLVVTDPPYGMNYRSNRRIVRDKFNRIENDQTADIALQAFEGMHRVLKDNSHIYVFCSWHHIDKFKAEFERWFTLKNVLVWNKNNHGSGDLKGAYAPKHEFILFGHKGRRHLNRRIPDVIDAAKVPSCHLTHPTEKPQSILTALIENSSRPGDIVFDPFMGTASTMIAADAAGRNGIGIEKDGTYFETARQRIEAKAA